MKKKKTSLWSVITNILIVIGILILISNIYLMVKVKNDDKLPSLFGYKLLIELSDSMNEAIETGDLLIVKDVKVESVKKGHILSYRGEKDKIITHRVTEVVKKEGKTYFETKGDNNDSKDPLLVSGDDIEGIVVLRLKGVGLIFSFFNTIAGKVVIVLVTLIVFLFILFVGEVKKENVESSKEIIEENDDIEII